VTAAGRSADEVLLMIHPQRGRHRDHRAYAERRGQRCVGRWRR